MRFNIKMLNNDSLWFNTKTKNQSSRYLYFFWHLDLSIYDIGDIYEYLLFKLSIEVFRYLNLVIELVFLLFMFTEGYVERYCSRDGRLFGTSLETTLL